MNAKLLLVIFTLSVIPIAGQTVSEIEQKYGKPTFAYSVTEHIWLTPDFCGEWTGVPHAFLSETCGSWHRLRQRVPQIRRTEMDFKPRRPAFFTRK